MSLENLKSFEIWKFIRYLSEMFHAISLPVNRCLTVTHQEGCLVFMLRWLLEEGFKGQAWRNRFRKPRVFNPNTHHFSPHNLRIQKRCISWLKSMTRDHVDFCKPNIFVYLKQQLHTFFQVGSYLSIDFLKWSNSS